LSALSCSYTGMLHLHAVDELILQSLARALLEMCRGMMSTAVTASRAWYEVSLGQGQRHDGWCPPLSDSSVRAQHREYFGSWGRLLIQFFMSLILGPILHSSLPGDGWAKPRVFLTQIRLEALHHSVTLPLRGPFRRPRNARIQAT
jgi:hypothetical protein